MSTDRSRGHWSEIHVPVDQEVKKLVEAGHEAELRQMRHGEFGADSWTDGIPVAVIHRTPFSRFDRERPEQRHLARSPA